MDNTGFVGMGLMGSRMAARLLTAGVKVRVWNRSPEKCLPLQTLGAQVATQLADLADCELILLCLADSDAVRSVVLGDAGLLALARPGQLFVDFSSIAPDVTRELAAAVATRGAHWVDAPVSGGVGGAESGRLIVMAGGEAAQVARLCAVAGPMAQKVTHMGPVGSGQISKICNQMIVASNAVLIAETVALAARAGVDAAQLAPALAGGFADSLPLQILAPRMATHSYEPVQWKVQTLLKDLDNALALARQCVSSAPISGLANQLLRLHAAQGAASHDLSSVVELFRDHEGA